MPAASPVTSTRKIALSRSFVTGFAISGSTHGRPITRGERHSPCPSTQSEVSRMDPSSLLLIRGLVGVAIGILAVAWAGLTIAVLVSVFGLYAILDGITNLVLGLTRSHGQGRSWAHAFQGVVGILAGGLTFLWPGVTALALVCFIGAWAIVTGTFEIIAAIRLRRYIKGEWLLMLSGAMSLLFGGLVLAFPGVGAVSIAWLLGIYATADGLVLITLGLRMRLAMVYAGTAFQRVTGQA